MRMLTKTSFIGTMMLLIVSCANTAKVPSEYIQAVESDGTRIVKERSLDIFVKRNIPEAYEANYRGEENFKSRFGVSEIEAIEHYTIRHLEPAKIEQSVHDVVESDTTETTSAGELLQDSIFVEAMQKLIEIDSTLTANVQKEDQKIKVDASTTCYISFLQGKSDIDTKLGNNESEIARIKNIIDGLVSSDKFGIDSIVVTASASPEGSIEINRTLAQKRSQNVLEFFGSESSIPFIAKYEEENWDMLDILIEEDIVLTVENKITYIDICQIYDLDQREKALQLQDFYQYIKQALYPKLRFLRFEFHLHLNQK